MSTFCDGYFSSSSSSKFSRISKIGKPESSEGANTSFTSITSNQSDNTFVHKPDEELTKFRRLWWEEGNINPQAKWEEATLPYVIAEGATLDEYEHRTDEFNVRGLWEWKDHKVIIYELPLKHHEIFISEIITAINMKCSPVYGTDAKIGGLGATQTRADNSGKGADASFRPSKSPVQSPNGSNGKKEPWPNLVVEVAYFESEQHVLDMVKNYWLGNLSRVHDAIVVKIGPFSEYDEPPTRMQAWHFCITDKRTRTSEIQPRKYVMSQTNIISLFLWIVCIMMHLLELQFLDNFSRIQLYWISC